LKTHLSILFFTSGLFLDGQALSGSMGPRDLSAPFKADKPITREEIRHRDRLETVTSPSIFQLASMDDQILKSKVSEFLSNYQIDEEMEVRLIDEMKLATGRHSLRYGFFWRDLPIYNLVLSAHLMRGELYFVGDLPIGTLSLTSKDLEEIPKEKQVSSQLDLYFAGEDFLYQPSDKSGLKVSPCIIDDQGYEIASCFHVSVKGVSYQGAARVDSLVDLERTSFSASGSITFYPKNPNSATVTETFDISPNNKLENPYFFTAPMGAERASSPENKFEYAPASPNFPEANIFAQANKMLEWYRSIGYNWDNRAIKLIMNATDMTNINNAGYYPRGTDGASGPVIVTGKGDGSTLRNLSLDSDVVAHEIGHHMIFRTITSTKFDDTSANKNHSGAIHEGMADFFAYARTGDSCLGESICPPGSPMCIVPSCLRTAALSKTDWNYESSFYKSQPEAGVHIKGMLVAATLWDAMKAGGNNAEFSKVALNSIDYLKSPASSYSDLFVALVSSDKELFGGKYCPAILASAAARGLGGVAAEAGTCETPKVKTRTNSSTPIVGAGGTSGAAPETQAQAAKAAVKKRQTGGCSVGGTDPSHFFTFLLLAPLVRSRKRG